MMADAHVDTSCSKISQVGVQHCERNNVTTVVPPNSVMGSTVNCVSRGRAASLASQVSPAHRLRAAVRTAAASQDRR